MIKWGESIKWRRTMCPSNSRRYSTSSLRSTRRRASSSQESSSLSIIGIWLFNQFWIVVLCAAQIISIQVLKLYLTTKKVSKGSLLIKHWKPNTSPKWSSWTWPSSLQPTIRWRASWSASSGTWRCSTSKRWRRIKISTKSWRPWWRTSSQGAASPTAQLRDRAQPLYHQEEVKSKGRTLWCTLIESRVEKQRWLRSLNCQKYEQDEGLNWDLDFGNVIWNFIL